MERAEQLHEQIDRYRRTYNDTATWLAETLDGSMFTPFEYTFDGRELYAEDGSALSDIFLDSVIDAKRLVAEKPELGFEVRRRTIELEEYADMIRMARGELPNTMVVLSDFPLELMSATTDVGGYNITRKQTMLRVLAWDGRRIKMYSQSLDGSDRQALEAIYHSLGIVPEVGELLGQRIHQQFEPEAQKYLAARLTGVYDHGLTERYGGEWHAGRNEPHSDTYEFVRAQHGLLDHFARRYMHWSASEEDRYNLAALMEKRFNVFKNSAISMTEAEIVLGSMAAHNLDWQLRQAGNEARSVGRTFSGCGISVGAGPNASEQLKTAGYGNKADEDKYGSRTFTCPKGHTNYRPHNQLIASCQKCGVDVSCAPPKPRKSFANSLREYRSKNIDNGRRDKHEQLKSTGQKVLAAVR